MQKVKKFMHVVSSIVLYSLLMIMLVVTILVSLTVVDRFLPSSSKEDKPPLFGAYVIISPSMVPNINVQDAVVTMRVPTKKLKMYDVITFLSKDIDTHGVPITHRIVGLLDTEAGELAFRTKGDNNKAEDRAIILQSEVLGKVFFRIPMLGYIRTFVTSQIGFIITIVLPLLSAGIMEISKMINKKNKNDKNSKQELEVI